MPQPRRPWWLPALLWLVSISPGLLLLALSLTLMIVGTQALIHSPQALGRLLVLTLLLAVFWRVYMALPSFVRRTLGSAWRRRRRTSQKHK
jgi:hypothetical protein